MKVKILFISGDIGYCNHCDLSARAQINDTEWEEIKDSDFAGLQNYVNNHLKSNYKGERAVLIRYPGPNEVKFSETVKSYLAKKQKEENERLKKEKEYKEKLAKTKEKKRT